MSKVAKVVAKVAAVVAVVAAVALAFTNPVTAAATFATLSQVAAVAGAVAAVSGTVAQLTAKKPPSRGSPNLITIGANQPMPIVFGETYIAGNKVHEVGYGGLVAKVENPYKFEAIIHSGCGPVESITGFYADFEPVSLSGTAATGYFSGFLYADQQLGARAEADALAPNWAGAPNWGATYKLSGYAASGISLKFDKDGKVFASGEPQWGVTIKGVKAYDARLDSTYPGGSGPQRINNRSTWAYSQNPGVVGATYAYGWFDSGNKQGGIGMPVEGIDMARWVEFANICDANDWKVGGVVYEPGSRWDNLKDICAAGGGEPYFDRHLLGVNYNAPRVSLDTITADDIADEGFTVASGRTWRERLNTISPKYRSGAHKWEYVPSEDVSIPAYVTNDGEEKREEITWNLVQDKDQVAQLAAYELVNRREIGQIDISCKPRLMRYTVGDMLTFSLPGTVIDGLTAVIIRPPVIDPVTGQVKLTMLGETSSKHDYALGKTGTAPPVPALLDTEVADNASSTNNSSDALNTATVYLYQRNNTGTAPALPTVPLTYTFDTALLSGGSLNGWSQSVPSATGGKYLFVTTQVAASDASTFTMLSSAWASVQILAQDGASGLNSATIYLYQRAASAPGVPSGSLTYTFATGVIAGATLGSWTQSVPAGTNPIYVTLATAASAAATDSIANTEWATPTVLAQNGTNGLNAARVDIYRRSATAPALPTTTATYTFATGALTGQNNSWTTTVPTADGNPLYTSFATASGTGATDTIANTEWVATTVAVQDGTNGTNGLNNALVYLYQRAATAPAAPSGTFTYTFATGVLSGGTPNSWSQTIPTANGNPLWVIVASASSSAATDSVPATDFGSPTKLSQDGSSGVAAISGYLTKEVVQLFSYANGNVVSYTPAAGSFKVFSGDTDVSTSFALSTLANPQTLTVAYASQTYSVTGGFDTTEDTASLTIRATGSGAYAGVTIDKVLTLSKAKGGYEIVATLPTVDLFEGRVVFLTTDGKLYRYASGAWTASVPAVDITGSVGGGNLLSNSNFKNFTGTLDTDGSLPVNWSVYNDGAIANTTRVISGGLFGTNYYRLTANATTTINFGIATQQGASIWTPGLSYIISFWARAGGGTGSTTGSNTATVYLYRRSATNPTLPTGTFTYTFSTDALTGGTLNSWTRTIPAGTDTLYRIGATANSGTDTVTIAATQFNGAVGRNMYSQASSMGFVTYDEVSNPSLMQNTWQRHVALVSPANNANTPLGQLLISYVQGNILPSGSIFEICGVQIEQGELASAYAPRPDEILPNTITATEIATDAVTAPKIIAGAIIAGKIAVDAVGANEIAAGSIIAGKIAANAVTANTIEAGSITAAKVGTNEIIALSANIKDGVIETAKIGDLQVSTLKIGNNAVTVPVYAYTSSGIVISSYQTIQSVSLTTSGGVVKIDFSFLLAGNTAGCNFRLTRNGTDVLPVSSLGGGSGGLVSFTIGDNPASGTYTYALLAQASGTAPLALVRSLFVQEIKK